MERVKRLHAGCYLRDAGKQSKLGGLAMLMANLFAPVIRREMFKRFAVAAAWRS